MNAEKPRSHVRLGIVITIILLITLWLTVWYVRRPMKLARERAFSANHAEILAACRVLLNNRNALVDESRPSRVPNSYIYLSGHSPQFSNAAPRALIEFHPREIGVYTNYVLIHIADGTRDYLVGFAEGAEEFGTTELVDGLWYWN
jgi:hypothetical protein